MPVGSGFYVKEGMISNELINVDTDKDGKFDHFYFSIWNQKLHAKQPLGNMRKLVLSIDKETIESERIFFVIRDQWICVEQMPTIKANPMKQSLRHVPKTGPKYPGMPRRRSVDAIDHIGLVANGRQKDIAGYHVLNKRRTFSSEFESDYLILLTITRQRISPDKTDPYRQIGERADELQ